MNEQIRRVAIWSGWLRALHALLAVATLTLMATGWLIANAPTQAAVAADVHYLAASVLVAALAVRLFLGFRGAGAERFDLLLPRASELGAMRASLLFYLSLGRAPLPNWYAHNPLWKPGYLILFLLLTLLAISGWLMPEMPVLGRLYLPRLHGWLSDIVWVLVAAHLFSTVLQDVKGKTADISAMLNGQRYFDIDKGREAAPGSGPVSIRLDDVGKS